MAYFRGNKVLNKKNFGWTFIGSKWALHTKMGAYGWMILWMAWMAIWIDTIDIWKDTIGRLIHTIDIWMDTIDGWIDRCYR